jgi:quinol-cytochrome oxidoreductase complex cytochrome b subunit
MSKKPLFDLDKFNRNIFFFIGFAALIVLIGITFFGYEPPYKLVAAGAAFSVGVLSFDIVERESR